MARPTVPILLSPEQNVLLQALTRSREAPHRLVPRAQIVLSASAGKPNKAIGQDLGLCEETVGLWRQRWLQGSAALVKLEHQPKPLRQAVEGLLFTVLFISLAVPLLGAQHLAE